MRTIAVLLVLGFFLTSCGQQVKLKTVSECKYTQETNGITINCPGQDPVFFANGSDGKDGLNGKDGTNGLDGSNGSDGKDGLGIAKTYIKNGYLYFVYTDGSTVKVGKVQGEDGADGQDGVDGVNAVLLTITNVKKNGCSQVYPGIYVENIKEGTVFDVYSNDSCTDALGEHCDNVETSFGTSGGLGNTSPGGGENCWVERKHLSATRNSDKSIDVRILDFK